MNATQATLRMQQINNELADDQLSTERVDALLAEYDACEAVVLSPPTFTAQLTAEDFEWLAVTDAESMRLHADLDADPSPMLVYGEAFRPLTDYITRRWEKQDSDYWFNRGFEIAKEGLY